jgi:formylglycine-generating enzyme required for sulfatase activity
MICSACKTSNTEGARFCLNCGGSLGVETPISQSLNSNQNPLGVTIAGKYHLDAKIGAGGMGAVYRATRLIIGDEVAVKILHAEQNDPKAAERFRREAQASARLKHPNAVTIYDFGVTDDGLQYLVMELVEGESLRQIIKHQGPITPSASVEIMNQVCAALDEAHRHNIIHRDIKPDNIIIHATPSGLRVKVLDFGIAKLRDDAAGNLTQTGSILGTPHYMSPEQCLGEELDAAADIYSVGIVLYEMLCGRVPFNSPVSTAVVVQHVNQPPAPPRSVNASISREVDAVVLRALAKRPESRPKSAGALARELSAAVRAIGQPSQFHNLEDERTVERRYVSSTSPKTSAELAQTVHLASLSGASGLAVHGGRTRSDSGAGAVTPARSIAVKYGIGVAAIVLVVTIGLAITWRFAQSNSKQSTSVSDQQQRPNQEPPGISNPQQSKPSTFTNKIGTQFLLLPAGSFLMGSSEADVDVAFADARRTNSGAKREWFISETPQHRVTIKEGFYMGKFEVTQSQWRALMGISPSHFPNCASCPVEQVSWYEAHEFIKKLNEMSDGYLYRLPSEAEWEYACRAGTTMAFAFGDGLSSSQANFNGGHPYGNAPEGTWVKKTTPVGSYQPNAWGLYDMHGNVYEWVEDIWADSYNGLVVDGSPNANNGDPNYRVLRGGSWTNHAKYCRSAYRNRVTPDYRSLDSGLRVVALARN